MTPSSPGPPLPGPAPRAPGWYGDPWGVAPWRWWDGRAWTANVHAGVAHRTGPRLPAWLSLPVLLCAIVVVPGAVYAVVVYPVVVALTVVPLAMVYATFTWFDRIEPEPRHSRVHATLWGATVAVVGAIVVNTAVALVLGPTASLVVSAPVVEETLKAAGILFAVTRRREVDGPIDGVVFAGWIAAGFAAVENVLYFAQSSAAGELTVTFVVRGLLSPFAHPLFTLPAGLAIGWAVSRRRSPWGYAALGLLPAIALHALWNAATLLTAGPAALVALVLVLGFVTLFVATAVTLVLWRHRQARRFVAAVPALTATYGLHPHELVAFSDWRRLLATRRALPDRATRRHFDAVHGAVARLVALHERPGGPTAEEQHRGLAELGRAREIRPA